MRNEMKAILTEGVLSKRISTSHYPNPINRQSAFYQKQGAADR